MPPAVRRYIKTSLVFLGLGLALGAWLVVAQFVVGHYPPRLLITAHVHLLLVGFMLMIVMGVATWMFPRPTTGDPHARRVMVEATYWTVTLATGLRAAAEVWTAYTPSSISRGLIAVGGVGQIVAAALFVLTIWRRIRMPAAVTAAR